MKELIDKKKTEDIYQLWRECFLDSKEYTDFYFRYKEACNRLYTIYEDHVLTCMLHLNPYHFQLGKRKILSNYIVGVATKKEYRKRGLMKRILTDSLHDMWNDKVEFTYLMPAAERIYYPYSFRFVYEQDRVKYILNLMDSELKKQSITEDTLRWNIPVYRKDVAEYYGLTVLTNELLELNFDCFTIRDSHYYEELHAEMQSTGGDMVLLYEKDELVGYFAYMVNGDEAEIAECIVRPEIKDKAIRTIQQYFISYLKDRKIKDEETQSDKLILTFLESYFLKGIDTIFKNSVTTNTPIIMARIVHFEEFIKNITSKVEISIKLKVLDPDIKDNEGTYELKFNEIGCKVRRINEKAEISLDIADLTRLMFHAVEIDECEAFKEADNDLKNRFKKINPYQRLYINEIV
jgi:predicted acetyltransferase